MNTRKIFGYGTIAVMLALLVCTLSLTGCPDEPDGDPPLSSDITISPAGPVTTGTQLTANYTGNETVSYQWKNGSTDVGTGLTCTPTTAGSYTVTVSAAGYTGKTSDAVTVTGLQLPSEITVTNGSTLAEKLQWVKDNAQSNASYTIEVSADEAIAPHELSYTGKSDITITLRGSGSAREISLSSNGSLFTVESGVTLVLDNNITLNGRSDNTDSLVTVNGALIMNDGAKITGNTTSSPLGGGVHVSSGTFTMNSGEISGNTAENGGGVEVSNGTFTMNGGEISGNIAGFGGGMHVYSSGIVTMSGGEISGNTTGETDTIPIPPSYPSIYTPGAGGGVYVYQGTFEDKTTTFTMSNGEISGNTASSGGGVYVYGTYFSSGELLIANETFTMSGGKISGNTANSGGGVYVYSGTFRIVTGTVYGSDAAEGLKNTVTGANASGAALYNNGTAQRGTFSDETWTSKGDLTTTDDTIKVVNGELE